MVLGVTTPSAALGARDERVIKRPMATGTGGAAATVDLDATRAAIRTLRAGGNAVDAAVAAAAVLGVTEQYSGGIGGGGFMLVYLADSGRVTTVEHREKAPEGMTPRAFVDPATGQPIPFAERVTSGLGVGVPGVVRGWEEALGRYGTWSLAEALRDAIRVARRGFVVDETFRAQTERNVERFNDFPATRALFLAPGGGAPALGAVLRNPDLAATYRRIARGGARAFYEGDIARAIVDAVRTPPVAEGATRVVRPGSLALGDLRDYEARIRRPTHVQYRGLDVYGMGPPSSGGSTVGEALNILEGFDLSAMTREEAFHPFIEASKLAFADRGAFVADPEFFDVPLAGLLSDSFAAERRALIGEQALAAPQPAGNPYDDQDDPSPSSPPTAGVATARSGSTTHLTVSDHDGNVVVYTFTLEQTGGSGIVVPGHGFLLNNELTDFAAAPPAPNAAEPGKRPRSSMAPTLVMRGDRPLLAVGTPGGSTIITTVLQILMERLDLGATLPEAIARPRISQRNGPTTSAEQVILESPFTAALAARGHLFGLHPIELPPPLVDPEIGAATGIEFLPDGAVLAAAEPTRRAGGAAAVVHPNESSDERDGTATRQR
jgi:gamma-glutamyltranspeptidase/glutathione hydrolase